MKLYGKNWKLLQQHIGTRNGIQIRSHAQKYYKKMSKEENMNENEIENGMNPIKKQKINNDISDLLKLTKEADAACKKVNKF